MLLTERIAQLETERQKLSEELAELEAHGGPALPMIWRLDGPPQEQQYDQLPADELAERKERLRRAIAEHDVEIRDLNTLLESKLSPSETKESQRAHDYSSYGPQQQSADEFTYSVDWRTVTYKGQELRITKGQARVIRALCESKRHELSHDYLMGKVVENETGRLRDTFRRKRKVGSRTKVEMSPLWGTLIEEDSERKGIYRLTARCRPE